MLLKINFFLFEVPKAAAKVVFYGFLDVTKFLVGNCILCAKLVNYWIYNYVIQLNINFWNVCNCCYNKVFIGIIHIPSTKWFFFFCKFQLFIEPHEFILGHITALWWARDMLLGWLYSCFNIYSHDISQTHLRSLYMYLFGGSTGHHITIKWLDFAFHSLEALVTNWTIK